jgi:hypothetical protein
MDTPGSKKSSSASKGSNKPKRVSNASSSKKASKADRASYYNDMIEPFHKAETQTFPKLDRLKKEGSQTEDTGMGDAVAKTENIRNWCEHTMGEVKLAETLGTNVKVGLT